MKKILQKILNHLAKNILKKYNPFIVAVAGDVGKTSTKDAIYSALEPFTPTGRSEKSYNNEIGIPLAIIGSTSPGKSIIGWLRVLAKAIKLIAKKQKYPHNLVLEFGDRKPGDMKKILDMIRPNMAVITQLSETPSHVEYFDSIESSRQEKTLLLDKVNNRGVVVINFDNEPLRTIKENLETENKDHTIHTYGQQAGADMMIKSTGMEYRLIRGIEHPAGIGAEYTFDGKSYPLTINNTVGKSQVYAVGAALLVAQNRGLPLEKVVKEMDRYSTTPGRLKLVEGIKNTMIIDHTYNASPDAMMFALDALHDCDTQGRKIALLADMAELGGYAEREHQMIGEYAAQKTDVLITVGDLGKFIERGAKNSQKKPKSLYHFRTAREAGEFVEQISESGDIILIKGSQCMRMEKAVEELMFRPELREELLVRQEKVWTKSK